VRASLRTLVLAAALALATVATFAPVLGNGFVDFDDGDYVVRNRHVLDGLTPAGLRWALTSQDAGNWHPLTWVSHMADVQLYGLDARGHHLTSLLLHAASAALFFLLLRAATGALWPSALAAALFALHPLRVESVAWAAERKDVLAVFLWMLTSLAYLRYARRPRASRYAAVAGLFALALMAKPVVVTLPLALLLLDFWPLGRWRPGDPARGWRQAGLLVLEKLPLLALTAAASALTLRAQVAAGAMSDAAVNTLGVRVASALLAYVRYLGKAFWPQGLSPFYPFAMHREPTALVAGAALALAVLTALALAAWRRRPWLAFGWLWYLGTLVPMTGIVQAGSQALADRYTYVPLAGFGVALAWGAAALVGRRRALAAAGAVAAVAALVALAVVANRQTLHWRDSESLFRRAVALDPRNILAQINLGAALTAKGRLDEADRHYRAALAVSPRLPGVHEALGANLVKLGLRDEAIRVYTDEGAAFPQSAAGPYHLASLLTQAGRAAPAEAAFREALRRAPDHTGAHRSLGALLADQGRWAEALGHFEFVERKNPDDKLAAYLAAEARSKFR
jgi:tetratricopeptide (TPR) repeat protein